MTHEAKASPDTKAELGRQVTQQEWRNFLEKWARYKASTLTPNNFSPQLMANMLLNCFCRDLQNDHQNVGLRVDSTEQEIINKIKEMTHPNSAKNRNNETKNPADVVYTTELPNNMEAMGLANFAMELTTTVNGKTRNLQLELTKAENRVGNQMRKPALVISIINNDLSKEIIDKIKEKTNPTNAKIGTTRPRTLPTSSTPGSPTSPLTPRKSTAPAASRRTTTRPPLTPTRIAGR